MTSNYHADASAQQQQQQLLQQFWQSQVQAIVEGENDFKTFVLPLARIKKVMKTDEDVKMISSEVPVLFSKACEIFIMELSFRSWLQTEECKRRTLQRSDVATAIAKSDVYDFLIDIVPREEVKPSKRPEHPNLATSEPYYYQMLAQQQQNAGPQVNNRQPVVDPMWLYQQQQQLQHQIQWQQMMQPQANMANSGTMRNY